MQKFPGGAVAGTHVSYFLDITEVNTSYAPQLFEKRPFHKGFGIVNKAEIDVFLELSCFFDGPADVGNLIFGSSAFSKTNLNIRKFMVHVLLKSWLGEF